MIKKNILKNFDITEEEKKLKTRYKLKNEQIYWKRKKQFEKPEYIFEYEYILDID